MAVFAVLLFAVLARPAALHHDDRAPTLAGTWACRTAGANLATHTYTRGRDALYVHNAFSLSATGERVRVEEAYRFDPRKGEWIVTSAPTRLFGAFHGTAPRWLGKTWTFTGAESFQQGDDPAVQIPMRIVYTWRSPKSFERARVVYDGDSWTLRSSERCTKTPR